MTTTTADRNQFDAGSERAAVSTNALRNFAELGGRVLLAALFLVTGVGKIGATGTAGYMEAVGVPSALLPVVIATEILGALAIIVGWRRGSRRFCWPASRSCPR